MTFNTLDSLKDAQKAVKSFLTKEDADHIDMTETDQTTTEDVTAETNSNDDEPNYISEQVDDLTDDVVSEVDDSLQVATREVLSLVQEGEKEIDEAAEEVDKIIAEHSDNSGSLSIDFDLGSAYNQLRQEAEANGFDVEGAIKDSLETEVKNMINRMVLDSEKQRKTQQAKQAQQQRRQ